MSTSVSLLCSMSCHLGSHYFEWSRSSHLGSHYFEWSMSSHLGSHYFKWSMSCHLGSHYCAVYHVTLGLIILGAICHVTLGLIILSEVCHVTLGLIILGAICHVTLGLINFPYGGWKDYEPNFSQNFTNEERVKKKTDQHSLMRLNSHLSINCLLLLCQSASVSSSFFMHVLL
jgi:hypothetical protein